MVHKDYKLGDPVWAKMKGFPSWPAKITDPIKPPFKKKNQHFVYFFGSKNYAWIMDESIVHHHQSLIDKFANRKTMYGLRAAINKIDEYCKLRPSTSTSEEDSTSITDENIASSHDAEISKPGLGKRFGEDLEEEKSKVPKKKKKRGKEVPKKRKISLGTEESAIMKKSLETEESAIMKKSLGTEESAIMKRSFGTTIVRFSTNFRKRKTKVEIASSNKFNMVTRKRSESNISDSAAKNSSEILAQPRTYMPPMRKKIGFLGLGGHGINIVGHLAKSGHNLIVFDRNVGNVSETKKLIKGVKVASSPKELILKCDIIVSCAADIDALNMFLFNINDGVLVGLRNCKHKKEYVEMTCVGKEKIAEIAELIKETGTTFLEAPVSSSDDANTGELVLFASGDVGLFNLMSTSFFHAISSFSYYVGDKEGDANAWSVITNSVIATISVSLAEALAYSRYIDLPLLDVIGNLYLGECASPITAYNAIKILNGDFVSSSDTLDKLHNDLQITLQIADEIDHTMSLMEIANDSLIRTKNFPFRMQYSSVAFLPEDD